MTERANYGWSTGMSEVTVARPLCHATSMTAAALLPHLVEVGSRTASRYSAAGSSPTA